MKIAILGSKDFDSFEYHFASSFTELGHDVFHIDMKDIIPLRYLYNYWAVKFLTVYGEFLFDKIARKVISLDPDLIICSYRFIHPSSIKLLKDTLPNVPIVQINPDQLTTFEKQQIFSSPYDFYFTKDPYIQSFMKLKLGLNAIYLPEAFSPKVHKKPDLSKIDAELNTQIDVIVFGSLYPYRARMVNKLVESGVNVTLFGAKQFDMPQLNGRFRDEWITGARKAELLYGSKIVFNNFHYAEIDSVNCKFFEIAGIGAFQICDFKPTIEEYSKIEPSKFTYNSLDEAIALIKYYEDKPVVRHELAELQYNHFLNNHTYTHRTQTILEIVFK